MPLMINYVIFEDFLGRNSATWLQVERSSNYFWLILSLPVNYSELTGSVIFTLGSAWYKNRNRYTFLIKLFIGNICKYANFICDLICYIIICCF